MSRVDDIVHAMKKQYGDKAIITGDEIPPITIFPSGIPMLDLHWGGGYAMGRFNFIAGKPASGKTSIAMASAARFQTDGFVVIWADLEKAFDPERARLFGLNPDDIIFLRSSKDNELTAELLMAQIRDILRSLNKMEDNRAVIVMDSLAANVTETLMEKDATTVYGGDAKANNQFVRNVNLLLDINQCFIMINELRDKIGGMGDPSYMTGGMAQNYFASTITWTRGGEPIKDGDTQIGEIFKWTVKKSRTSPPKEIGSVKFFYNTGFDVVENLIETAIEMGIVQKGGAGWYDLPGGQLVRGLDNFMAQLKTDEAFMKDLNERVYTELYKLNPRYQYQSPIDDKDVE